MIMEPETIIITDDIKCRMGKDLQEDDSDD